MRRKHGPDWWKKRYAYDERAQLLRDLDSDDRWADLDEEPDEAIERHFEIARERRNPRKISIDAAEALEEHRPFKRDNTEVRQLGRDKSRLYLHGHAIAGMRGDEIYVTDAGYPTSTTKERLNALPDVRVHTSKGQLYLNGKKWSGNWTRVGTS